MVPWTLAMLLAAAPEVGPVLVTKRTGLSAAEAEKLRVEVERALQPRLSLALKEQPLAAALKRLGAGEPSACAGRRACIAELGRQLGVPTLVAFTVSRVEAERAGSLELLDVASLQLLAQDAFVIGPEGLTAGLVSTFVEAATRAVAVRTATRDAPTVQGEPVLRPVDPEAPRGPGVAATTATPPTVARERGPAVALLVSGVVLVSAAAALLAVAAVERGRILGGMPGDDGLARVPLREEEALAAAQLSTGLFVGGATAGILGLGLGTGALLTW